MSSVPFPNVKDLPDIPAPGDVTAVKRLYRLHQSKKAYLFFKSIENDKERFSLLKNNDIYMLYQTAALALQFCFTDNRCRDIFPTDFAQTQEVVRLYRTAARAVGWNIAELFSKRLSEAENVLKALSTDKTAADWFRINCVLGDVNVATEDFLTPQTSDEEDDDREMDIDIKEDDEDDTKGDGEQA